MNKYEQNGLICNDLICGHTPERDLVHQHQQEPEDNSIAQLFHGDVIVTLIPIYYYSLFISFLF